LRAVHQFCYAVTISVQTPTEINRHAYKTLKLTQMYPLHLTLHYYFLKKNWIRYLQLGTNMNPA